MKTEIDTDKTHHVCGFLLKQLGALMVGGRIGARDAIGGLLSALIQMLIDTVGPQEASRILHGAGDRVLEGDEPMAPSN